MTMILDGTLGETFPSWTTAGRPASPSVGQMGYNTTIGAFDAYTAAGWVSVASSATAPVNGPAFSAYPSTNQSMSSNTVTKILFQNEEFDTNNNFASSRFTPTVAGYYFVEGHMQPSASYTAGVVGIYKNGSIYKWGSYNVNSSNVAVPTASCLVYLNGSTDYVEFYGSLVDGQLLDANSYFTWFQGYMARAA